MNQRPNEPRRDVIDDMENELVKEFAEWTKSVVCPNCGHSQTIPKSQKPGPCPNCGKAV